MVISPEKPESWLAFEPPVAVVVDEVGAFIEAGCNTIGMRFRSPEQRRQLVRCISDVMPQLRGALTV